MSSPSSLLTEFTGAESIILERLNHLYPSLIDLSLSRLERLLEKLEHPEQKIPPVMHIAGTNGKGSTTANLRAIAEHAGWKVHVFTSPHLVSVRERFRVAGQLVEERELIQTLEEIEYVNAGAAITVFEVLTAAAFMLFSRTPADLTLLEVGLGGTYDATNIVANVQASLITAIAMDHEAFLGTTLKAIASEKAGIIKRNTPIITLSQEAKSIDVIEEKAKHLSAPLFVQHRNWDIKPTPPGNLLYQDDKGTLTLPAQALQGPHQIQNAGLAIAAFRMSGLNIPQNAYTGIAHTQWPARLQRLTGELTRFIPADWKLWLDGGHNPHAAHALAKQFEHWKDKPLHLIIGMKQTKDVTGFFAPLSVLADTLQVVAEEGQHLAVPVDELIKASHGKASAALNIKEALTFINAHSSPHGGRVVICGSLYLAGLVLKMDGWQPR